MGAAESIHGRSGQGETGTRSSNDPLRGVAEEIQIHLGEALDWVENQTEPTELGLRITLDNEQVQLREWSVDDFAGCFDADGAEAEPFREVVLGMALLLRTRDELAEEVGTSQSSSDLDRTLELYEKTFERIEKAIDAAVLRGGLVAARNLSRFRDLLLVFKRKAEERLETAGHEKASERRTRLKATGEVFTPAGAKTSPATSPSTVETSSPEPAVRSRPRESAIDDDGLQRAAREAARADEERRKADPTRRRRRGRRVGSAPAADRKRFPVLFFAVVVMALVHWGLTLHLGYVATEEPVMDEAAWERLVELQDTFVAGGIFYGTVGSDWYDLDFREQRDRFQRLHERAELAGFEGVVLRDSGGDFIAMWSKGGIGQVWTASL